MHLRLDVVAVASILALLGCRGGETSGGGAPAPSSSSTSSGASTVVLSPATASTSVATSSASSNDWPADHEHHAPHGGLVHTAGDGHLELLFATDGTVTVWLLDGAAKPVTAKGAKGTVDLESTAGTDVTLTYDAKKDALVGRVEKIEPGLAAVLVVEVTTADGKKMTSRFDAMPKG